MGRQRRGARLDCSGVEADDQIAGNAGRIVRLKQTRGKRENEREEKQKNGRQGVSAGAEI